MALSPKTDAAVRLAVWLGALVPPSIGAALRFGPRSGRLTFTRLEVFVAVFLFGVAMLVVAAAVRGAIRLVRSRVSPRFKLEPFGRRMALLSLVGGLALLGTGGYARWIEPFWLEVQRVEIRSPEIASPLRLVVVSDLHSDARFDLDDRIAAEVNALEPDVIFFLGDSLNSGDRLPQMRAALTKMKARVAKLAVRGNWDVWYWSKQDLFGGTGFEELRGGWQTREIAGTRFNFGGHPYLDGFDPESVIGTVPNEGFSVLLYHANDYVPQALKAGVDLYLCGDTHGGQVAVPLWGSVLSIGRQGRRYVRGLYEGERGRVFVTAGLGVERGFPLRRGVRPEIAVLELKPSVGSPAR